MKGSTEENVEKGLTELENGVLCMAKEMSGLWWSKFQ